MALRNPLLSRWTSQIQSHNLITPLHQQSGLGLAMRQRPSQIISPTVRRAFSHRTPLQNQKKLFFSPNRFFSPPSQPSQIVFRRFFNSTRPRNAEQSTSLSQRLKTLSREYGWSALWIYLFLSALDFPICFAAVRLLGADTIGHYEHVVVESVKGAVDTIWPGAFGAAFKSDDDESEEGKSKEIVTLEEGKKNGGDQASLWTQLALAYAVHKSLIFIRVPLTAAITPKVVKVLRQWGWDIVKGKPKGL